MSEKKIKYLESILKILRVVVLVSAVCFVLGFLYNSAFPKDKIPELSSFTILSFIVSGLIYLLFKIITDNYKQYKADKTGKRPFYEFNKLPFFGVLLGGALMYFYALYDIKLQNSAALYMGLPFLLALGITLIPKSQSITGAGMKLITIMLLLSVPILKEGFICIIMSAPIFYIVVLLITGPMDHYRNKKEKGENASKLEVAVVSVVLSLASLEGTHEAFTFDRYNEVSYTKIIESPIEEVRDKLSETPKFEKPRPFFSRLFPLPKKVEGAGLKVGDERKLHFVYNKWFYFNAHEGDTIFKVVESTPNKITFSIPHDDSYLSNYLTWKSSEVELEELGGNKTKVTWKLAYERKIDPAWYFGNLQKYTASLTAQTLIDNVADPRI